MTVLVSETWAGSGNVNGKVPTTGGGTWVVTGAGMNYGSGGSATLASPGDGTWSSACLHSATYTNAAIIAANLGFGYNFNATPPSSPARLWARADASQANGYFVDYTGEGFGRVALYKRVSGGDNLLGTFNLTGSETVPLALHAAGSVIRATLGRKIVLEVSDSTFASAGYWGIGVSAFSDPDNGHESFFNSLTIETPYVDVSSTATPKNVTNGQPCTVGVGYLGAADIALISQSILATLQATPIPVDVQLMNSAEVIGTGTTGDAWRGVGVLP